MAFFIKGPKGDQGDTGPSFTLTKVEVPLTAVTAATTIDLFVAATTGTLNIWGHLTARDTAANIMTVAVRVNVTDQTAQNASCTLDTISAIPICTQVAVTAGQTVRLRVTMDVYSANAQVDKGVVLYNIT